MSYKHTQAWLIGSCTVITAEAIRLVPAPWATQQGVARQRGLVWGRIVVCVSVCVCYCGDERGVWEEAVLLWTALPSPSKNVLIFTIQWFIKCAARIALLPLNDLKRFLQMSNQFRLSVNGNVDLQNVNVPMVRGKWNRLHRVVSSSSPLGGDKHHIGLPPTAGSTEYNTHLRLSHVYWGFSVM